VFAASALTTAVTARYASDATTAVAVLGALQTIALAWLVYTLAASRQRYARRAAESAASLEREAAEKRARSIEARRAQEALQQSRGLQPGAPRAVTAHVAESVRVEAPDVEDIIDPAEVLLRCNRNGDLGATMLQLFAESLPAELASLEVAAAADDMAALGRIAHKMRGAAATLAAARLAGAISGLELFLKHGDDGPLADRVADVRHEAALLLGVVPQTVRRLTARGPSSPASL